MKLDIPKNTWISEVTLDFFKEGFWASAFGLQITFTGNACPGLDFIAEVIEPLSKINLPKRKIVRFKGFYHPTDPTMSVLVKAFRSWGFKVQAIFGGDLSIGLDWADKIDWSILRLEKPLALVAASEIWYCPPVQDPLPEPKLPPADGMLLYINKGYSMAATVKFIVEAERNWNLL